MLAVLVMVGLQSRPARAGRLDSVRSEVSGDSDSDASSSGSSGSSDSNDTSDCCDDWDSSTGGSSWTPGSRKPLRYRHYPYEGGTRDYLFPLRAGDRARKRAGHIWADGAYQGKGLWRTGGGLRLDGQYIGIDGDLSYYLEPRANDALYLGTLNLNLIPVRGPRGLLRLGGGINTMIDGRVPGEGPREYALGWNVTTSLDLFPAWPVVVSMRLDGGRLYEAWMGRARGTVGVMMWRFEIFGGYEHTQVGRVGLGGPLLGAKIWL